MDDKLTQREIQCVLLAGQGLSDKEIAQRLRPGGRMSHKTVSNHLGSAFRKLGVSNRTAAAAAVTRNYPVPPIPMEQSSGFPFVGGVPAGSSGDPRDGDGGLLYRSYVAMGEWRTPPRVAGSRLPIILVWTLTGIVAITAALGLVTVFGSANQAGQNAFSVVLEDTEL